MDQKASVDQLGVTENISCESVNKLDKNSAAMETMDIVHLSSSPPMVDNGGFSLSPITPDSNKENSDVISCFTSPLTIVSSNLTTGIYMNEDDDCPNTPKDGVFDPFAPGPDNLMLAPLSMKYLEESRSYVARRLNFSSLMTDNDCENLECVSETGFEDDMVLEAVYDSLLEAIIHKQAEDILGEISAVDSSPDAHATPLFAPRLTGIAETCPGAPLKSVKKSRNIDLSLCRKLEFDC